jgi:hypothetical protein
MSLGVHSGYKVENLEGKLQTTCLRFSLTLYDSAFVLLQNKTMSHVISEVSGSQTFLIRGPAKHQLPLLGTVYDHLLTFSKRIYEQLARRIV